MALIGKLLRAVMRAPPALLRPLATGTPAVKGRRVDPHTATLIRGRQLAGEADMFTMTPERARRSMRGTIGLLGEPYGALDVEDRRIDGPAGALPLRLYRPRERSAPLPAVVFFHGGGWVVGDLDAQDHLCAALAREVGCVVISVDYRLAPEHPFPAAADDALAAVRWTHGEAEALGVDPDRLAVAGSSAGGNLAAVVAQDLRDDEAITLRHQTLLCPVTDASREASSYDLFAEGFLLSAKTMRWFVRHYLPEQSQRRDPRASPLLADSLEGLPPAYVAIAGFDPLRDEGLAYAKRLREAGVTTELALEPSTVHGIVSAKAFVPAGRRAFAGAVTALRRALS